MLQFGSDPAGFERALRAGECGDVAKIVGHYSELRESTFRDLHGDVRFLRELQRTRKNITVLCSKGQVLELQGTPSVRGSQLLGMIPDRHYGGRYHLPLSDFADIRLRRYYAEVGIELRALGGQFKILFGVFIPDRKLVSQFVSIVRTLRQQGVDDFTGRTVCDTFSGSGVLGLLSGQLGARWVHLVDIDPLASQCASSNISDHAPSHGTSVHTADIFPEELQVDTIIANPPWKQSSHHSHLRTHFCDSGRRILRRFLLNIRARLNVGGAVYLFYEKGVKSLIREVVGPAAIAEIVLDGRRPRALYRVTFPRNS